MAPIIDQLLHLLSAPVGNLIYSLVLGLTSLGTLFSSFYASGKQVTPIGKRTQTGLLVLVLAQLVIFAASWGALIGDNSGHFYLPPLDRMVAIFSLVLIIWLWVFPRPQAFADVVVILAEIGIIVIGILGMLFWLGSASNSSFNSSMLGGYSYYLGLGLLVIAFLLLLMRRPRSWGYAVLMMLILLSGYVAQYVISQADSDYTWFVHLGEMIAFLCLLALPSQLIEPHTAGETMDKTSPAQLTPSTGGPALLQAVMNLLIETSPQQYYQELTQVVAEIMNADYCILMMQPKSGDQLIVPVGYSRVQARVLDGFSAEAGKIPSIQQAIKSGTTMQKLGSKSDPEVQTLASQLGMTQAAQFLMVPFQLQGISAIMSLGVLSRPSATIWKDDDARQLREIAEILVTKAGQYSKGSSRQTDQVEMMRKLQRAEAYADQVRLEYAQLKAKYDSISTQATLPADQTEDLAALAANQKNLQDTVKQLEDRNLELENLLTRERPSVDEVEQLRQELRSALTDLARIPSTLSKSDQQMLEMQLSAVKRLDEMQPVELVTSIAQEFRQPISSIIGYTDLLLGESVGILGALQRKFVERVKASTERLGILLNELVQVMSIDGGIVDQTPASVDLKTIVDEAIGNITAQINEKNIMMKVDVPDVLPTIRVNQDALQQILANLLQNACLVTPLEGEIKLAANVEQKEDTPAYILISITDQGGGIDKADLPRVFLRRYKMDNPLIQGIGDTGVGLSIVKSLVELYKGRVWVDTKQGVGSTFSVLLPLVEDQSIAQESAISTG